MSRGKFFFIKTNKEVVGGHVSRGKFFFIKTNKEVVGGHVSRGKLLNKTIIKQTITHTKKRPCKLWEVLNKNNNMGKFFFQRMKLTSSSCE